MDGGERRERDEWEVQGTEATRASRRENICQPPAASPRGAEVGFFFLFESGGFLAFLILTGDHHEI